MSTNKENPTYDTVENEIEVIDENHAMSTLHSLPPKMQRFIHMYMTGQYTLQKLAQLLEVHPNTLGNWLKREDVQLVISDMQESTHKMVEMQLKALTLHAVNKLGALVNSPIDGVALQATKDILDRGGHKSKQEIKVDKTIRTFEEKMNEIIEITIPDDEQEVGIDEETNE